MRFQEAIAKATAFIRDYGLEWVVDMGLSKCFDTLDHELIIHAIREKVADGSILKLIRMFLESGVLNFGVLEPTDVGSPQGGVISPLLANIYLDKFDQYMRRKGQMMKWIRRRLRSIRICLPVSASEGRDRRRCV